MRIYWHSNQCYGTEVLQTHFLYTGKIAIWNQMQTEATFPISQKCEKNILNVNVLMWRNYVEQKIQKSFLSRRLPSEAGMSWIPLDQISNWKKTKQKCLINYISELVLLSFPFYCNWQTRRASLISSITLFLFFIASMIPFCAVKNYHFFLISFSSNHM